MTNFHILSDVNSDENPVFDLIPGKHAHFMDVSGEAKETEGLRVTVPMLDLSTKVLMQTMCFVDEMEGTTTHPEITIVIKKADETSGSPAKMGVFAL